MRFLMLVCTDDQPIEPRPTVSMNAEEWVTTMDGRGVRLLGERVRPEADATTVRVRGEELVVTDGPFLETKEALGGFDVLECRDLDEAIKIAAAHPMAQHGVLELRPFWD